MKYDRLINSPSIEPVQFDLFRANAQTLSAKGFESLSKPKNLKKSRFKIPLYQKDAFTKKSIEPKNIVIDTRSIRIGNKIGKSFSVYAIGEVIPNFLPNFFFCEIYAR